MPVSSGSCRASGGGGGLGAAGRPGACGARNGGSPAGLRGVQRVVPVAVEAVPGDRHGGERLVADLNAGGVRVGVQLGVDAQAGAGGGRGDGRDDDLVTGQGTAAPVHGDVGEQPVLDRVPLRGTGRKMTHRDIQARLPRQRGQLRLPRAGAVPVRAARIRGDQQPGGVRIGGPASRVPPAAQGFHRERGGVVVGADVHPAGVRRHIVDPVRQRFVGRVAGEVVAVDAHRFPGARPGPPGVLELPDQLLLLRVHADHRRSGIPVFLHLAGQVPELGVPVGMLHALQGLGVALQAEALPAQQLRDGIGPYHMPQPGQLVRQHPRGLGRPAQRRHRITALRRLDQRQESRQQCWIPLGQLLPAAARAPDPAQWRHTGLQLRDPLGYRALAHSCSLGHHPDPAMPQRPGLCTGEQTTLPLVQMREQRRELRRKQRFGSIGDGRSTSSCPVYGTYGLFFGGPLACYLSFLPAGFLVGLVSLDGFAHVVDPGG